MSIKLKKQILEAIDQLRGRKARPDIERICNHLQRRYNVEPQDTIVDLEKLVDQESVMRVEYKGNTSYRNVAKWPRYNVYKNKPDAANLVLLNSERTTKLIASALNELIGVKPMYRVSGVPYEDIQNYLKETDDSERFEDKIHLNAVLARELNCGTLVMLENGNYVLETRNLDGDDDKFKNENATTSMRESRPKKLLKPWLLDDIKEEKGIKGDKNLNTPPLSPKSQKMIDVLSICKTLRDAEKKAKRDKSRARIAAAARSNALAAAATAAAAVTEAQQEWAEPDTKTTSTASRVGSRRKRARQVFDPSDNNLPRNRTKRGRPITANTKQLQQHALQHQLLRMQHQQTVASRVVPATPPKEEPESSPAKRSKIIPKPPPATPPKSPSPSPPPPPSPPAPQTELEDSEGCCIICKDDISSKTYRLVHCQTCSHRVHPVCLKNLDDPTLQPSMKHALKWRCMECRTCTICGVGRLREQEFLVACQTCDDSFHASCHSPALLRKPSCKWMCYRCTVEKALSGAGQTLVSYGDKNLATSVPILHSATTTNGTTEHVDVPELTSELGDVSSWTCENVAGYFASRGFLEEASVLKQQAVDGKSLLLMKRMDVLRGLNLKLGPALKIYTLHVLPLQQRHFVTAS